MSDEANSMLRLKRITCYVLGSECKFSKGSTTSEPACSFLQSDALHLVGLQSAQVESCSCNALGEFEPSVPACLGKVDSSLEARQVLTFQDLRQDQLVEEDQVRDMDVVPLALSLADDLRLAGLDRLAGDDGDLNRKLVEVTSAGAEDGGCDDDVCLYADLVRRINDGHVCRSLVVLLLRFSLLLVAVDVILVRKESWHWFEVLTRDGTIAQVGRAGSLQLPRGKPTP